MIARLPVVLMIVLISEHCSAQDGSNYVLDTVHYDVDIHFGGRQMEIYTRHDGKIMIYNILGRVVAEYESSRGISTHYLWNEPYGCYFVSVIANKRRTTVRVILD